MRREEDEIQVLGSQKSFNERRVKKSYAIIIFIIIAVILTLAFLYFCFLQKNNHDNSNIEQTQENITELQTLKTENTNSSINISNDSINDVPLLILALHNLKPELQIGLPDTTDQSTVLALPAADIRKDNQEIVGDFILQGNEISRGKRKVGYCSIIEGKLEIGISTDNNIKDICLDKQGSLFRQYILVFEGKIQKNILKGKSYRRALIVQNNQTYIIISKKRESLYDFSEAISDLGFQDAIYLVGGDSFGFYRNNNGEMNLIGKPENEQYPKRNYIVFKK